MTDPYHDLRHAVGCNVDPRSQAEGLTPSMGTCVICHGALGDFGRDVFELWAGRVRFRGYSCRGCTRLSEAQP